MVVRSRKREKLHKYYGFIFSQSYSDNNSSLNHTRIRLLFSISSIIGTSLFYSPVKVGTTTLPAPEEAMSCKVLSQKSILSAQKSIKDVDDHNDNDDHDDHK